MRPRNFNILLAILLSTALMASFATVAAKPVKEHPDWVNWPAGILWGAELSLENSFADVYFGAKTTAEHVYALPPPPVPPYVKLALRQTGTDYAEITRTEGAAPQSYTWYVEMMAAGISPAGLTISADLENATNWFVPQDHSVILENAGAAIGPWNLRVENGSISLSSYVPKNMTLYVDNAVNIESIDNLDPLSGTMGDTLRLNVFVKNTGIKTDTYNVSAGGGIDPVLGPIAVGVTDNVIVTTTLPGGTADIVITAAGAYATDQDSVSATGTTPIVVKGFDTAWTVNDNAYDGIEPWIYFSKGENPAAMVAKDDVGSGGVAACGFMNSFTYSGGYPWYGDNLDIFLDNTFQYIKPGAVDILWWDWNTYYTSSGASSMIAKLEAMGYNVDGDDRPLENMYAGYSFAGTITENLLSTDDSFGVENNPTVNGQSLDSYDLWIGSSDAYSAENARAFIKWDLTGLSSPTSITSATLLIETYYDPDNDITVGIYQADDAWNEDNLSWDNMPAQGALIDTLDMTNQSGGYWWSVDVTAYVTAQFGVDNIVSIKLESENEGSVPAERHFTQIASRDSYGGIYGPFLEITYEGMDAKDKGIENYDIFVIGQLQFNDPDGPGSGKWGGDPDAMSDESVEIIREFVQDNGKGLFIGEAAAYTYQRYNYNRVHNRILHELDFGWWFQHDAIVDNENSNQQLLKMGGYLDILADPEDAHPIGAAFIAAAGHDNIRIYKSCSLIPEPTITATVAVPSDKGPEESSVTLTVTLTNTSGIWDNFSISVDDTEGWPLTLIGDNNIYFDPGASDTVDVQVDIPAGTAGTVDIVTVTATSFSGYGSKLTFDGSGNVTSESKLAFVNVEILPNDNIAHCSVVDTLVDPSYRYDPLTFAVKVTNGGRLDDKYELSIVTDNDDLGLKLTPQELFVPTDDAEYASLSVTIPEDWWAGDIGEITVVAVGMISTENQINLYPTDNDTVGVEAGENRSVEIEILPDSLEPQTGAPDSPLVWLVVIKNTGNTPETFYWSGPNEVLSGVSSNSAARDSWGATLDNTDPVMLDPSTKAINYLRVTVPGDAKTSEWNTITVDIATYDNVVYDEYTVMAHVLEPGPRIPEGVIEIAVEAEVIAIYVHPTQYDFEVMDEHKVKDTDNEYFKVRNTGNVNENILVRGTDAQSMPGEPVTTWELDDLTTSIDQYRMAIVQTGDTWLKDVNILMWDDLEPGNEELFGLKIQTPTAITTPARMWARVKFIAIASGTTDVGSSP